MYQACTPFFDSEEDLDEAQHSYANAVEHQRYLRAEANAVALNSAIQRYTVWKNVVSCIRDVSGSRTAYPANSLLRA
jgi:hypothetical protein